ncbi:mediator complex subunit 13 C-terminal-domain-containing protein [Phascolomyces articulosus]|uniref:Mediator of RNA polymerase II transcription subunit 13 n=1 Tax=Phascolomyces articulosus TaxID=60185 RepID=A0AAD5KCH9_9FUNG|nr:mediator complex subunit 13 C-terminal-domain-containing protein [Phascolomyces articulosus]
MVTESSLTNILVVNGVSQIRYRAYTDTCERSTLLHSLKRHEHDTSTTTTTNVLIQAFNELCDLNIPCTWRAVPRTPKNSKDNNDTVKLELWVFWFDERHTGLIDANYGLNQLEEVKMGTFTWETITNGLSTAKTASPSLSSTSSTNNSKSAATATTTNNNNNLRARGLVSVFEEYKLFIRSIRNVMHKSILAYGAIPLGELYIMPESSNSSEYDLLTSENYTSSTTAAIAYNAYITGTDLVFRPYTRQLRLRRYTTADGPGTKVILSPTGEPAYVTLSPVEISEHSREKVFQEWSVLFNIPFSSRTASLVAIRTKTNATVLYPSTLVFVPTSIRDSPTIVSGMNGVLGKNRGLTQDIGKKWEQWAWSDLLNKRQQDDDMMILNDNNNNTMTDSGCRINYWNYNKKMYHKVLEALGETSMAQEQVLIQRMMEQPIILSPIMAAKSVGTPSLSPFTLPVTNDKCDKATTTTVPNSNDDTTINLNNPTTVNNATTITTTTQSNNDSLQDFIMRNFAIHPSVTQDYTTDNEIIELTDVAQQQGALNLIQNGNDDNKPEVMNATVNTDAQNPNITEDGTSALPQELPQPLQAGNLDDFGLSYSMDAFSNHRDWDNGLDNDLGDFDFDVTEADFDFFASGDDNKKGVASAPATATMAPTDPAAALAQLTDPTNSLLPMEDIIQHATSNNNPLGLSGPVIIKEEPMELSNGTPELPPSIQDNMPTVPQHLEQQPQDDQEQQLPQTSEDIKIISMPNGGISNSPVPSDATAVASSDAGTSTAVPATFDTSIYTMTPESSRSPTLVMSKSEYATEHQHLVPRDFAPVSFIAGVDNAKYLEGGKFTYIDVDDDENDKNIKKRTVATKSHNHRSSRSRVHYNMYRPDYIPRKLMKSRRKAARLMSSKSHAAPIEIVSSSDSDSSSCSSSSDEDDDSTTSSNISLSSQEVDSNDDIDPVDRLMHAQMAYVRRLLGDTRNKPKRHRIANVVLDYDSPFGGIIVDSIHPEKFCSSDMIPLDHLCQQTVWGGYPFTGVLPDSMSSSSDGTFHDEAAEAIVARQTELIQSIRGDITHVPSLNGTTTRAISDFKQILEGVFHYQTEDDMLPSLGSISVKGPLKVQDYYELSAENAPVHSKYYGKFQVKKRKTGEPNLNALSPPEIVVGRQSECIQGATTMIGFWEKLRLEPYSSKNSILYFVLYPDNHDIAGQLSMFFTNLNSVYETCQLGTHRPGSTDQFFHGAVPIQNDGSSWLNGYTRACEALGTALGHTGTLPPERGISNIVIYLMNPSSQLSSNLDLSRCFSKILSSYAEAAKHHPTRSNFTTHQFVMQIIPLNHALRLDQTCTMVTLKDIAFSIYSQCHSLEDRLDYDGKRSLSSFYTPPWVIAPQPPDSIKLSIDKPIVKFPTIVVDPTATLHMAYSFSLDRRWMVIVWSDHRGELLEFAVLEIQSVSSKMPVSPLVKVFTEAWTRTRNIARRTGISWSYVLAKIGLIFESELQAWLDSLHSTGDSNEKVAIVGMDIESPLHFDDEILYKHGNDQDMTQSTTTTSDGYTFASSSPFNTASTSATSATNAGTPTTPNSTGSSTTIKPSGTTATPKTSSSSVPMNSSNSNKEFLNGDTTSGSYMIMLNHRVAYSRQRVNIYQGDLAMEAMNELDSWILSLSTGYLIISRNPALVQGLPRSQPLALELHLVYNNLSSRTPYTALHDIIKQYNALSYVNYPPSYAGRSNTTLLPTHIALVERLCRILLVVGS